MRRSPSRESMADSGRPTTNSSVREYPDSPYGRLFSTQTPKKNRNTSSIFPDGNVLTARTPPAQVIPIRKEPLNRRGDSVGSNETIVISGDYTPGRPRIESQVQRLDLDSDGEEASLMNRCGSATENDENEIQVLESRVNPNHRRPTSSLDGRNRSAMVMDMNSEYRPRERNSDVINPRGGNRGEPDPQIRILAQISGLTEQVLKLRTEVKEVRDENEDLKRQNVWLEKQITGLREYIDHQLEVVPTDIHFERLPKEREQPETNQFVMRWNNKLRAERNVDNYKVEVDGEEFTIHGKNNRAVVSAGPDPQRMALRPVVNGKTTRGIQFVFESQPSDKENEK